MTRYFALLAALLIGAAPLAAQATPPLAPVNDSATSDTLFLRAQRMAAEGQGDAARALVQHEIDTASAGSPRYVDALYWRAVVAATAADAEKDLRRIIIEFPLSPRNEDALLRLAQLEMTRGDNDQALAHLQRLVIDHPTSPSRARAHRRHLQRPRHHRSGRRPRRRRRRRPHLRRHRHVYRPARGSTPCRWPRTTRAMPP